MEDKILQAIVLIQFKFIVKLLKLDFISNIKFAKVAPHTSLSTDQKITKKKQ